MCRAQLDPNNGITLFQSGAPFTVYDGNGGNVHGSSSLNPSVTSSLAPGATIQSAQSTGSIGSRLDHYLNWAAFASAPAVGSDGSTGFGTLGRNTFRGPGQQSRDISIGKSWTIREGQSFRFRAEFFNAWNHPSFASPAFPTALDIHYPDSFGPLPAPREVRASFNFLADIPFDPREASPFFS